MMEWKNEIYEERLRRMNDWKNEISEEKLRRARLELFIVWLSIWVTIGSAALALAGNFIGAVAALIFAVVLNVWAHIQGWREK